MDNITLSEAHHGPPDNYHFDYLASFFMRGSHSTPPRIHPHRLKRRTEAATDPLLRLWSPRDSLYCSGLKSLKEDAGWTAPPLTLRYW